MLLQRYSDSPLWTLKEIENLRQRLNTLFPTESDSAPWAAAFPPLNTWVSQDGALVTAELPGIEPDGIELSVVNDTLTIKGSHQLCALKEGETLHRQERGSGQFSRSIQLPFKIEADKVDAKFSKGILEICLPRAESEKPRKISVQSN